MPHRLIPARSHFHNIQDGIYGPIELVKFNVSWIVTLILMVTREEGDCLEPVRQHWVAVLSQNTSKSKKNYVFGKHIKLLCGRLHPA